MSEQYEYFSHSPEETEQLARALAEKLSGGELITLAGDLGAGKTSFTKGLAKGLGVKRTVNSPTFTIIKEYVGYVPFYHMDAYRLEDADEDLGLEEYFDGDGVTVVEWPSMIQEQLPPERLDIMLEHLGDMNRKMIFMPLGDRYHSLCKEIFSK
ncbi:tRNA threonylcarbamoyladenosine biosynthesis protein TsaE [Evansella caseinilytica]|uniref:tRNA threonylcarbamoyladenosine biosynthesis protein TsaE n=1 Tax=Evansella caseinilytica TaxID=1503961 RepID=A0A1H3TJX6_9BACI|nr:tRNA (adenosine(37)-N6)-threonylcarbamoyltransferase complex ATPase subunit type 1 TsaE [Evansella caseinilytica]SDZ50287.1 tRNA threonylcarbamoyladenosine biosynthesis protein TsaE [Evansella caseinilytica]